MTLEELIYKRMSEYVPLIKRVTTYAGKPAVFFQMAPDDHQKEWEGKEQYPRIVYAIDMQTNQERKSAGIMEVSLLCDEAGMAPEEMEPLVRECLKDLILNPEGGFPYCFTWSRTDAFEIPARESGANTRVFGVEIRFDVLEYPSQETTDPDPIVGLNQYLKKLCPKARVIGLDFMDNSMETGGDSPVFYCRFVSEEKVRETNTVVWMDCKIAIHIIHPKVSSRMKQITAIANQLSLDGEVILLDQSPMFVNQLTVNHKADYLSEGQILLCGQYGLLRYQSKPNKWNQINITWKEGDG